MSTVGVCEVWCQSPEGFECRIELPVDSVNAVAEVLRELEEAGFTPRTAKVSPTPRVQPTARSFPTEDSSPPWCERHECRFKLYRKNDKTWWAHLVESTGEWCNHRASARDL